MQYKYAIHHMEVNNLPFDTPTLLHSGGCCDIIFVIVNPSFRERDDEILLRQDAGRGIERDKRWFQQNEATLPTQIK